MLSISSALVLYIAAILVIGVAIAHSVLGERYLISRLSRLEGLPHLLGGPEFAFRILRFAWHITTVAWFGFAAIFVLMAHEAVSTRSIAAVVAVTFVVSAVITVAASRGRHLAWVVFLAIGTISLYISVT